MAFKENLEGSEQQIMMLNNGCLCCTVKDDLLDMLEELVRLTNASHEALHPMLHAEPRHLHACMHAVNAGYADTLLAKAQKL